MKGAAGGLAALALLAACAGPVPGAPSRSVETGFVIERRAGQPSREEYDALQRHLMAAGLMRTDLDPADAPYSNADLVRNFGRVAFYVARSGLKDVRRMRRWEGPVRYRLYGSGFGAKDVAEVEALMGRIARLTGRPVAPAPDGEAENFAIYLTEPGERDRISAEIAARDREAALVFDFWRSGDEAICMFNIEDRDGALVEAHVFIGTETAGLLRRSCFHEEIVQAMGLPNDHELVRPSLFNDDEEFALFTRHDEWLMRLLYHPDIRPGMTFAEAEPVVRALLRRLRPEGETNLLAAAPDADD